MVRKILKDRFYHQVYERYGSVDMCIRAGFFDDGLEELDYKLYIPSAQTDKVKRGLPNPVVLCTTGGFYPIHDGHIRMMERAKEILEKNGYSVAGGFFSPCNPSYTDTKPNFIMDKYDRIVYCYERLRDTQWSLETYECLYMPATINFTDVVNRLEKYLQKYVDKNIRVAYVFGGDNAEFMYCFENDGIGVCINRSYTNELFHKTAECISSARCFFVDADEETSSMSSRAYRNGKVSSTTERPKDCYLIRNEGLLPLGDLVERYGRERVEAEQEKFLDGLVNLFREYVCDDVEAVRLEEQVKEADCKLEGRKTISLDAYYNGTYNVRASRLFNMDDQKKFVDLAFDDADIASIPAGRYTLVDDDSVSGNTLRRFKEKLREDIVIDDVYLLMSSIRKPIFDVVDLRDFIIGAKHGGLKVILSDGRAVRLPYIRPFVDLNTRANVPQEYQAEFSRKVLELNISFYEALNKDITLEDIGGDFAKACVYFGFSLKDRLLNILETYRTSIF